MCSMRRVNDRLMDDTSSSGTINEGPYHISEHCVIAGKTLEQWREFARRDDCLDRMVPSDLRQLIAAIK